MATSGRVIWLLVAVPRNGESGRVAYYQVRGLLDDDDLGTRIQFMVSFIGLHQGSKDQLSKGLRVFEGACAIQRRSRYRSRQVRLEEALSIFWTSAVAAL